MFKNIIFSVFIIAAFCASAVATETPQISQAQLLSLLSAPLAPEFIVLDVRSKEEFEAGHIVGALNISHDQIGNNLSQLSPYKNSTLIVHCKSGRRAGLAEDELAKHGFSKLRHLTGDMNGWQAANLATITKQ